MSNPFTLLAVDAVDLRVAYMESLTGTSFVKNLGAPVAAFEDAQDRALSEKDSRVLLENRSNDL